MSLNVPKSVTLVRDSAIRSTLLPVRSLWMSVQVQSQCYMYVVGNVELNVVGHWLRGTLQELRETLITQFHRESRLAGLRITIRTEILYNIGVVGRAKEMTFFLKPLQVGGSSGVTEIKECGCIILAAQMRPSHLVLHTPPQEPVPRVSSLKSSITRNPN